MKDTPNIPDDIKTSVNDKIAALKKEQGSGAVESIKSATEALSTELQKIGEYLAKQQPSGNTQSGTENPDVKDAEVKEEKKNESEDNK